MPRTGEINRRFGIFKSVCCGADIVIPEDVTFPNCGKHRSLPTEWMNITYVDRVPHNCNKSDSSTVAVSSTTF
jgi:hypothetical protein